MADRAAAAARASEKLLKASGMCHKKLQTYESARTAVAVVVVVVIAIVVAHSCCAVAN